MRVGVGVLDGPHRTCANFPINRRAGCPQPADWPCAALPAGHTGPALQKYCVLPRADRVVRPYKGKPCRAGPMCPALHYPPRPLQKTCHCEPVTDVTGVAIRTPLRRASGGPLSFFGERKGGKNAVKTKVLKSFPRLRCRLHRSSLPRVSGCANFAPCFRIVSASPSATRSALVLPWRDGGGSLRLPHSGRRDAAPYGGLSVNGA